MRSPGAPSHRNEIERRFWKEIATGITSEKAAEAVGVSQAVGSRWFRHRGGMPLFMSKPVSERYLSFAEREEIALLRAQDVGVREIARLIERSPSTVSRELTRNAATRCGQIEYRASVAQWKAELVARRPKPAKLVIQPQLRQYVQDRLEGNIQGADGRAIAGPRQAPFKGATNPIAEIENGSTAGRQNRLPTGSKLTFQTINLCESLTKPFTKLSIFKVGVLSNASW
jgi:hypothetical protein